MKVTEEEVREREREEKMQVHIFVTMYSTAVAMVICGHVVNPETSRHMTCTYLSLVSP